LLICIERDVVGCGCLRGRGWMGCLLVDALAGTDTIRPWLIPTRVCGR
jgi:hypothetical protein